MSKIEGPARPDLLKATDAEIEDAIKYADPMALRGLVYQLTGDEELKDIALKTVLGGYLERNVIAREEDVAMVRRKAADFLKGYRDSGAGPIDIGPEDRLPVSLGLMRGEIIPEELAGAGDRGDRARSLGCARRNGARRPTRKSWRTSASSSSARAWAASSRRCTASAQAFPTP
jgi:hypothetical protein